MHRLDLGLYSHPKEFGGGGGLEFEPMLTPREKSPLRENFPRGGSNPRRCGQRAQTLPTSYSGPQPLSLFHEVEQSLYVCLQFTGSGVSWPALFPLPLWAPGGAGTWFSQGLSSPSSLSVVDFIFTFNVPYVSSRD